MVQEFSITTTGFFVQCCTTGLVVQEAADTCSIALEFSRGTPCFGYVDPVPNRRSKDVDLSGTCWEGLHIYFTNRYHLPRDYHLHITGSLWMSVNMFAVV